MRCWKGLPRPSLPLHRLCQDRRRGDGFGRRARAVAGGGRGGGAILGRTPQITGWADVVLPEASYLERYDELRNSGERHPSLALRAPAFEPLYDSKPGWWIAREIAHRLGLNDYFPWKDSMEYAKHRVKGSH